VKISTSYKKLVIYGLHKYTLQSLKYNRHRRWQRPQRASHLRQQRAEEEEQLVEQEQQDHPEQLEHPYPQRADHNRARAVELWGQQLLLEQSPAENPLCHNSLPRQPPARSSWSPDCEDRLTLECSISSPSLMRSSNDESCSELADLSETFLVLGEASQEDDSLSPAHTTIITARRSSAPAVVQQSDIANETVTIERHLEAPSSPATVSSVNQRTSTHVFQK